MPRLESGLSRGIPARNAGTCSSVAFMNILSEFYLNYPSGRGSHVFKIHWQMPGMPFASLTSFSLSSTGLPTKAMMRILWFFPWRCFRASWKGRGDLGEALWLLPLPPPSVQPFAFSPWPASRLLPYPQEGPGGRAEPLSERTQSRQRGTWGLGWGRRGSYVSHSDAGAKSDPPSGLHRMQLGQNAACVRRQRGQHLAVAATKTGGPGSTKPPLQSRPDSGSGGGEDPAKTSQAGNDG